MKRVLPSLVFALLFVLNGSLTFAENEGQEDLDKATELQLKIQSLNDVEEVIALAESALKKGLDEGDTEFAKQLLVGALWQHASQLSSAIFDQPRPHPRWPMIRTMVLRDLEKLLENDEAFGDAYILQARLLALPRGDRTKALESIGKAIEIFEGDEKKLSEAYLRRATMQEKDDDRLADLDLAIEADPSNTDAWQVRAAHFISRGELEKAVESFRSLLKEDADNVPTHQALAEALANLQQYDLALEHLATAIKLAPQQSMNYTLRARIREQQDDLVAAVEDLDKALKIQPGDPFALLTRARLRYLTDDLEGARGDIERVLQDQPGSVQAILLRSMISGAEGRFRDAVSDLQMILNEDPDNTELQMQIASFYMADGRPRKAIEMLTKVIAGDESNWFAMRTRADARLSIGAHREAIEDYEMALKLAPEDDGILNNLAWVLCTSPKDGVRDGERAIELATKACEVTDYKMPHILSTLAAAFAETGDFEAAIKWSQKSVELGEEALKDQVEQLKAELKSYQDGKPWRELQETEEKPAPPRRVIET